MATNEEARKLVAEIADLEKKKQRLAEIQKSCPHQWGQVVSAPIIVPGHYEKQYAQNLGFQKHLQEKYGNQWVPETSTPRWIRTCAICGLVTETSKTETHTTATTRPAW